jgi:WD40 repeat protein
LTGFQTAAPIYTAGYKGSNDTIVWKARATVQFQDIASGTMGATTSNEDFVGSYELSPDGKILASAAPRTINGAESFAVTLWDVATGSEIKTIPFTDPDYGLDFSADGSLLAVGVGNNVQVIEVSSGKILANLSGHSAPVSLVAFSPDGKLLASTGQDNQLILWQVTQ